MDISGVCKSGGTLDMRIYPMPKQRIKIPVIRKRFVISSFSLV